MLQIARNQLTKANVDAFAQATQGVPGAKFLLVDQALVDADRSEALARKLNWHRTPAFSGSRLEAFGPHGPQLLAVPELPLSEWTSALNQWLALEPTGAGLSLICARADASAISSILSHLALATVDGDHSLHCRCADARVLTHLLPVLTPRQSANIAAGIQSWWWWDAQGGLCSWVPAQLTKHSDDGSADLREPLRLSAQQYANVLDGSEPDIIFALLMDKTSELVPESGRGDFRATLQRILAAASSHAVQQTPDRLQFVVLSLAMGESFHLHPGLQAMWQRIRDHGASLSVEMQAWSDDFWAELDHGRKPAQ